MCDKKIHLPEYFMREAIRLAREGMIAGEGGPFGAVVVKDGKIIGRGNNKVLQLNDPTAHAEVVAIRDACKHLGTFQLDGCDIYTSCEPCPMCFGAVYWARPARLFFACNQQDAAAIGFDDAFIYHESDKPAGQRKISFSEMLRDEGLGLFKEWATSDMKKMY